MSDLVPVKRALISVFDKTGLPEFARALHSEFNVELLSTGGTARFLRELGLPVTDVSDVTNFPEMMDGRVKTLHPKIHGGLLAIRDNPEHRSSMEAHGIRPIDLVCINLYPFEKTIAKVNATFEEAIENIDIGGPAMIRSAAKNHRYVLVVTSPERYEKVLGDLREHGGACCGKHRLKQAQRAFAQTAAYDARIADYLAKTLDPEKAESGEGGRAGAGTAWRGTVPRHGAVALAAPAEPEESTQVGRSKLTQRLLDAPDYPEFTRQLLTAQAVVVAATEAALFRVVPGQPNAGLELMHHIRPGDSDAQTRAAAIHAFENIIQPCVAQGKDGAIEVDRPDEGVPQFCLVTVLRNEGGISAVSAVITRATDLDAAKDKLTPVQLVAGYHELYFLRKAARTAAPVAGTFPQILPLLLTKQQGLRYGENPHQQAALYVGGTPPREASVAFAKQHHGKELSYINLLDADAAMSVVKEFAEPAACIVKHATPCGAATATDLPTAFKNAFAGDPLAAFGGIVALNHPIDRATAEAITSIDKLLEVIVAPAYHPDALDLLKTRWKNVRLLEAPGNWQLTTGNSDSLSMHKIVGGYLVQERDLLGLDEVGWKVVSKRAPSAQEMEELRFAWLVCKHVKSNAIVIAKDQMLVGAGAGQMDRPSAARLAIEKAGPRAAGAVAASDAFFPFPDAPRLLLDAGITALIHPGGSLKDQETVDLVNDHNASMILTSQRHFRH